MPGYRSTDTTAFVAPPSTLVAVEEWGFIAREGLYFQTAAAAASFAASMPVEGTSAKTASFPEPLSSIVAATTQAMTWAKSSPQERPGLNSRRRSFEAITLQPRTDKSARVPEQCQAVFFVVPRHIRACGASACEKAFTSTWQKQGNALQPLCLWKEWQQGRQLAHNFGGLRGRPAPIDTLSTMLAGQSSELRKGLCA